VKVRGGAALPPPHGGAGEQFDASFASPDTWPKHLFAIDRAAAAATGKFRASWPWRNPVAGNQLLTTLRNIRCHAGFFNRFNPIEISR
jgi:hypothetical protein